MINSLLLRAVCLIPLRGLPGTVILLRPVWDTRFRNLDLRFIPFVSPDTWVHELTGLALKNVDVTLWKGKKKIASRFGEMLFTHFGISGPAVLMLSTAAVHSKKAVYPMEVVINLKPALSEEKLYKRLERDLSCTTVNRRKTP